MSDNGLLVIHIFEPLSTYESPSRSARVRIAPGSEPPSASVSPKQPTIFPDASSGRYFFLCSSEPYALIGNMTRLP